ncbi:hypothetical protein [Microvirga puerhi]|uniref:Uncharacterized protein n=1 Tax=Microvirga puerhi TaxID=2876078 RepID=A0ABS7VL81_9HYPH|nr:hypothetical protein [Microvirga puerhi]MBZ6075895.1 hypothetical protein [Microvirga puerhi]
MESSHIKSIGYLISCLSVALLGIVSWKSASEQLVLMLCLIFGMLTSVIGMGMRWLSYQLEHKQESGGGNATSRKPQTINSASDATS